MNQMTMNQLKEVVHQMKKKEETSASLQLSVTRSGTKYQISVGTKEDAYQRSDVTKEDDQEVDLVRGIFRCTLEKKESTAQLSTGTIAAQAVANAAAEEAAATTTHGRINAELKPEQLSIDTTAAQTVANAAAEKAAADAATLERAAAEQTVDIDAVEHTAAINADAEAAATADEEIKRLQLLLIAERDATAAARAAANEAAATINKLEVENKRILLLLTAEQRALQRQIQYLQEQLYAQAIPAQWQAHRANIAETVNAAETMASISPVPVFANEPSWKEHIQSQPGATIAKSNPATYAQAVISEPSLSSTMKRLPRNGANATGRNPSNNAAAAALQDVADAAAAAANCQDPNVLEAVLKAAATTAKALAECRVRAPQGHRRGGRPPRTRKERPRAPGRRRRPQRSASPPAPRVTDTHTATQSRRTQQGQHNPPTANSLLREGQNRPRPGAPFTSSNHAASSAMPATRFAPPLSPAVTRRNGRNIADSAKQPRMTQQGQHNPPTANSLLREGQNRPRPGAPFTSSNHAASSAMPATRFAPPLSPAVTRRNGRDIAESM